MNKLGLYKLILTSLFAALAFAGCFVHIPLPVGKVHLGNFICIMASFFVGPLLGGFSGALGMALSDVVGGYGVQSIVRTIILKFFMGLISGFVFNTLRRSKVNNKKLNLIVVIVLAILTALMIVLSIMSYKGMFNVTYEYVKDGVAKTTTKSITFHWIIPLILALFLILSIVVLFLDNKINNLSKYALYSSSLALSFNIFGEVFIKALLYYWISSTYASIDQAFMYCVAGLPSTIITSVVTLVLVSIVFFPIWKAVSLTSVGKELDVTFNE